MTTLDHKKSCRIECRGHFDLLVILVRLGVHEDYEVRLAMRLRDMWDTYGK